MKFNLALKGTDRKMSPGFEKSSGPGSFQLLESRNFQ
jgi:hypothetical protein